MDLNKYNFTKPIYLRLEELPKNIVIGEIHTIKEMLLSLIVVRRINLE